MNRRQQTELSVDQEERRRAPSHPKLFLVVLVVRRLLPSQSPLDERLILRSYQTHNLRLDLEGQAEEGGGRRRREGRGGYVAEVTRMS